MGKTEAEKISNYRIKKLEKKLRELRNIGDDYTENTIKDKLGQAYLDIGRLKKRLICTGLFRKKPIRKRSITGIF